MFSVLGDLQLLRQRKENHFFEEIGTACPSKVECLNAALRRCQ